MFSNQPKTPAEILRRNVPIHHDVRIAHKPRPTAQVRFAKTLSPDRSGSFRQKRSSSIAWVRSAKTPSPRAASKAWDRNSRTLRARREAALRIHRNVSLQPLYFCFKKKSTSRSVESGECRNNALIAEKGQRLFRTPDRPRCGRGRTRCGRNSPPARPSSSQCATRSRAHRASSAAPDCSPSDRSTR